MRRFWPELTIVLLGLWFGSIFSLTEDRIFAHRLTGDSLLSPFFYDHVSRAIFGSVSFEWLSEFNLPEPKHYTIEFPNTMDALIFAPIHWLFDWPTQWNVTLHGYVLINGLSMAFLARVLGFGPIGVLFAGLFGLWFRAPFVDIAKGRIQTVGIGFFIFSLGATLGIQRHRLDGTIRNSANRRVSFVGSVVSTTIAALIYPPFLVLLLPLGMILWFAQKPERSDFKWLSICVLFIAVATAIPLMKMLSIRQFHGKRLECPTAYNHLRIENIFAFSTDLVEHAIPIVFWMTLPLVFLIKPRRKMWSLVIGTSVLYVFLSLGPCSLSSDVNGFLSPIHYGLMWLQDWGRLSTIAIIGLSLFLAAVLDGLASKKISWLGLGVPLSAFLCLSLLGDLRNPIYWHTIDNSFYQRFMKEKEPTTAVVFPFDSSQTILDVLSLPHHRLVNPLRSQDPPMPEHNPSVRWMFELGKGNPNPTEPTLSGFSRMGLKWIIYDPQRCESPYRYPEACAAHVYQSLNSVLGQGEAADSGVVIWELKTSKP